MAGAPTDDRTGRAPQQGAEREKEPRREAGASDVEREREDLDPREEEGWTQPESSAQKGAQPDEG
jgi:hypothetical protein